MVGKGRIEEERSRLRGRPGNFTEEGTPRQRPCDYWLFLESEIYKKQNEAPGPRICKLRPLCPTHPISPLLTCAYGIVKKRF